MSLKLLSVFCLSILSAGETARILAVFPFPSISHQVVFRPITQELARRGHEVVVITPDPAFPKGTAPTNLTEVDVHDISYNILMKNFRHASRGSKGDLVTQVEILLRSVFEAFEAQVQTEEMQKILKDEKDQFDLLLLESCVEPTLALSHVFKVPVIQVASTGAVFGSYEAIGAPNHLLLYPNLLRQRLNNLTVWDKISEIYTYYQIERVYERMKVFGNKILQNNFGENMPNIDVLRNNIDMLMLNSNPVFEGIRPVPQSVIYMGGMHMKPDKPLPTELKDYLDASKNGVVYVSFGTNVDPTLFSTEKIQTLVKVFSKLPYDVLFKWNSDELPGRTANIRIEKWLPQSDLLKHPKVKLFITQGGLQSTDEAITAGVPLVGIPMLADQWFNVEKYVQHKVGIRVDMETLTEEILENAINTVIGDDSYRCNIVKLRTLMADEPMKPLERAMWWIEYVLRHGGAKHLRSPAANISWAEYLEIELVLTVLLGLVVSIAMISIAVYYVYRTLTSSLRIKLKFK